MFSLARKFVTHPRITSIAGKRAFCAKSLYVGNLNFDTKPEDLSGFFSQIGNVVKVTVPKDLDGNPRGYAFVSFGVGNPEDADLPPTPEEAQQCSDLLHHVQDLTGSVLFNGRTLRVRFDSSFEEANQRSRY
ncbi:hypothetical protein BB560_005105 [Smittium megazygosporum]|uniref:RRM domain-containing protein n=1 Tax=Smittium megazygosporum TaxID=133381 RepID=A0A2T9Z7D8_9FUNG|nr:hypothetical protein BB560_005105 [Smittium megazygosporum]